MTLQSKNTFHCELVPLICFKVYVQFDYLFSAFSRHLKMPVLLPTINGEGAVLKPQPVFYTIFKIMLSFRKKIKRSTSFQIHFRD